MDFFVQVKVLLYKEFLRDIRSWKTALFRLLLPSVSLLVIILFVNVNLVSLFSTGVKTGSYGDLPKCKTIRDDGECVTLLYNIPFGSPPEFNTTVTKIMQNAVASNPTTLEFGVDVLYTPVRLNGDTELEAFTFLNPNYTYGLIQWESVLENDTMGFFEYTIFFNASTTQIFDFFGSRTTIFIDNFRDTFEVALERGVIQYLLPDQTPSITVNVQSYPSVFDSLPGTITWGIADTVIYVFVTIPSLLSAVYLVDEKAIGIKGQMRIIGLMDSAYWVSTIIEQFVVALISIVLMCSIGKVIPGYPIFHDTNLLVLIFVHMVYQINCIATACFYSTLFSTKKKINIMMAMVIGLGTLIALTFSLLDVFIYFLYYFEYLFAFAVLLQFIPTFSFAQILLDIKVVTVGATFPFFCFLGHQPTEFTFSTLFNFSFESSEGYYEECVNLPTPISNVYYILITSLIYFVITFYFAQVVSLPNSMGEGPLFFLQPSFWRASKPEVPVYSLPSGHQLGLDVIDLSKTYQKGLFSNSETVTALRPISFQGYSSSVLCLLGPNGAGKSTCISCLTGSVISSEGDAYIYGYSVRNQIREIKRIMGLCPQFDVLWDDLTAMEHLTIFNGLKPASERMSKEQLQKRLEMVRLHNLPKVVTKSYSGGMKRRLSVVLSTIGNPKIIFLDEPTTGMDPDNRRYVWDLLQEIKKDKLIILTTHSMEEADKLSDYVVMIAKGKLRCAGIPLELKHKFGAGYRLSLSIINEHIEDMKNFMKRALPDAYLRNENAGSLVYALPDTDPDHTMADFFDFLNSKQLTYVKEWGLQNTTLEDVFITVTNKVMGEDIDFNANSKKANFDTNQRDAQQKTLQRYEKRYRALKSEAAALRELLDQYQIDHKFIASQDVEIQYGKSLQSK